MEHFIVRVTQFLWLQSSIMWHMKDNYGIDFFFKYQTNLNFSPLSLVFVVKHNALGSLSSKNKKKSILAHKNKYYYFFLSQRIEDES